MARLREWYGAKVKKAGRPKANGDNGTATNAATTAEDSSDEPEGEEGRE